MDFLGYPKTRLSSLVQSDAEQRRFGFQEARNGQSLPVYAQRKSLSLAHRSEFRHAHTQGALLIAIIGAEIRLADIQMMDRGGEGRYSDSSHAAVSDRRRGMLYQQL